MKSKWFFSNIDNDLHVYFEKLNFSLVSRLYTNYIYIYDKK